MTYEQARDNLARLQETLEPQDNQREVLGKALQALDDCLDMGLSGDN